MRCIGILPPPPTPPRFIKKLTFPPQIWMDLCLIIRRTNASHGKMTTVSDARLWNLSIPLLVNFCSEFRFYHCSFKMPVSHLGDRASTPRATPVGFVVDKVAPWQVLSKPANHHSANVLYSSTTPPPKISSPHVITALVLSSGYIWDRAIDWTRCKEVM